MKKIIALLLFYCASLYGPKDPQFPDVAAFLKKHPNGYCYAVVQGDKKQIIKDGVMTYQHEEIKIPVSNNRDVQFINAVYAQLPTSDNEDIVYPVIKMKTGFKK